MKNNIHSYLKYFILIPIFLLSSCVTSSYIVMNNQIASIQSSSKNQILKDLTVKESSKDYLLYEQEKGRVYFIYDDVSNSIADFNKALDYYNSLEQESTITVGKTARGLVASSIGSDNSLRYTGSDFERALIYYYQGINYLEQKQIDKAMPSIRAANDIQKLALAKHEKLLMNAHEKLNKLKIKAKVKEKLTNNLNALSDIKEAFLNPMIYYLSGNIRELAGDYNGALVDYKNALNIIPQNKYLLQDTLRLSKVYDESYFTTLVNSHSDIDYMPFEEYKNAKTILIVYEQDFVPAKQNIEIALPFGNSFINITLPAYQERYNNPFNFQVETLKQGKVIMDNKNLNKKNNL